MRILCLGDSNTYGFDPRSYFGGRYPKEDRWVDILAQKTGWEMRNAGENGLEIPYRAYEVTFFHQMVSDCLPLDGLVVMLGYNDLLQGAEVQEVAARMERFLRALPVAREKILLVAPPPMRLGGWVTEEGLVTASAELNRQYQALAQRMGTAFADAGSWNIALTFDQVHFSAAGHRTFAERLYPILLELVHSAE